jgi:hypothetical protein
MCKSIKKGCLQTDLSVHGQLFYYERSVLRQLFHAGNIAQNAIELLDYGRVTENIAQYNQIATFRCPKLLYAHSIAKSAIERTFQGHF